MKAGNPFSGKSVVVTGKLDNYTRAEIKARLIELGAHPTTSVSTRTSYLIVGEKPGSKLDTALALGITILSELEFESMAG